MGVLQKKGVLPGMCTLYTRPPKQAPLGDAAARRGGHGAGGGGSGQRPKQQCDNVARTGASETDRFDLNNDSSNG